MQPRERHVLVWTVIGAVAGLLGSGAALYPLLTHDSSYIHLVPAGSEELRVSDNGDVTVESLVDLIEASTLGTDVVLTGRSTVQFAAIDGSVFEDVGVSLKLASAGLKDMVVQQGAKKTLVPLEMTGLEHLRVSADSLQCFKICPDSVAEIEIGIEYSSKDGPDWAYVRLPVCLHREFKWYGIC